MVIITTKKILLSILAIIFISNFVFSKDKNTAYFIGTYDLNEGNKTGICSDRGMEKQTVLDFKAYEIIRIAFKEKYKLQNPGTTFIAANRAVIIYSYNKRRAGWNCTASIIAVVEGKDLANAQEILDKRVKQFPNDYTTLPKNIFLKEANSIITIPMNTKHVCCENLPTILISEEGFYYWKLDNGCYKKLSKLEYETTKKLTTEPERKRHIQNCSGNAIDTIQLKAQPFKQY